MEGYSKTGNETDEEAIEAMNYSSSETERAQTSLTTLETLLRAECAAACIQV